MADYFGSLKSSYYLCNIVTCTIVLTQISIVISEPGVGVLYFLKHFNRENYYNPDPDSKKVVTLYKT